MKSQPYELPELGFSYDALEPALSAELLELHHSKHHRAYVDAANQSLSDLAQAREKGSFKHLNQLQRNLAFHVSGHVLHSIFWRNLTPGNGAGPDTFLSGYIQRAFGGFTALEDHFCAAGASIQGSGWAALIWDPLGHSLLVEQIHDHQDNTVGGTVPLLVLDMWEHAFYLQYRHEKHRWISVFWKLINWPDVSARLQCGLELDLGLARPGFPVGKSMSL